MLIKHVAFRESHVNVFTALSSFIAHIVNEVKSACEAVLYPV